MFPKRIKFESKTSICTVCNVQIGMGNGFEWSSWNTKSRTGTMKHPFDCRNGIQSEMQGMKAKCSECDVTATKVGTDGNWKCDKHLQAAGTSNISIPEIVKELKKYISVDDLEKITEVREKLKELDIENIVDELSTKRDSINESKGQLDFLIEELQQKLEEQKSKIIPQAIEIKILDKQIKLEGKHKNYPKLLNYLVNKKDTFVHGPAGSGKNTAVFQASQDIGTDFHCLQLSQLSLKSELTGYRNIMNDNFLPTTFVKAYENGGIFLADEFDNWAPTVVTSVNMAIANGFYEFSHKTIQRHKDFVFVALGNTIGLGAENHYVTSRAISGASRDRFRFLNWPIDENLEFLMVPKKYEFWVKFVQVCRKEAELNGNVILITPRATIQGAEDLELGFSRAEVIENVLLRGQSRPNYLQREIEKFI